MAESLRAALEKAEKTLSSDAQVSDVGVRADTADIQPFNLWYGRNRAVLVEGKSEENEQVSHEDSQSKHTGSVDEPDAMFASGPPPPKRLPPAPPNGTGTTIAILDSGINLNHTAFKDRISPHSKSFVSESPGDLEDLLGHGTQCAGLACGSPDTVLVHSSAETLSLPFSGIAPEATLLVCKVVPDDKEEADIDAVCRALTYVVEYNEQEAKTVDDRVTVVSLSFGAPYFNIKLSKKIQEVVSNDVIVVCAASNDGRKCKQPITYPARLGHVLCIGSCNQHGKASPFSPVGRELDFLAVGEEVWAPTIGGPTPYTAVSGTSFAAPLVAGVVCQIVQDLKTLAEDYRQPLLEHLHNVWGIREILKHMSVIQGTHDQELGFGMLKPMEYFEKTSDEKMTILSKILS